MKLSFKMLLGVVGVSMFTFTSNNAKAAITKKVKPNLTIEQVIENERRSSRKKRDTRWENVKKTHDSFRKKSKSELMLNKVRYII